MKKISQEQGLTLEEIKSILCEVKKGDITRVTFKNEQLRRFFPRNYTNDQIKQAMRKPCRKNKTRFFLILFSNRAEGSVDD